MAVPKTVKGFDDETHVSFEDQQKINLFAKKNLHLMDLREEMAAKEKELQNLEDAGDDLMLVEDEMDYVPYQIGGVFVLLGSEEAQGTLDGKKEAIKAELERLKDKTEEVKKTLAQLKVQLYARFGDNINLESE